MVRYTGPKNRVARKFGVNIFSKSRNPLLHKPHPPGQHGARRKKKSDYGVQLEEKQKLRAVYGMIPHKTILRYYRNAILLKGNTPDLFIQQLECRLDVMVYRLKFASSIFHAQQLVAHGHVYVNGKRTSIRSFQVQPEMVISLKEKSRNNELVKKSITSTAIDLPEYVSMDPKTFSGSLLVKPHLDQIPLTLPISVPVVCEYLAYTS